MTSTEAEQQPSRADVEQHGLYFVEQERDGDVPGLDPFYDFKKPRKDRKSGKEVQLPAAWANLTNSEIFDLIKQPWLNWVDDPAHGATAAQQEKFRTMIGAKKGSVSELADDVLQSLKYELPLGLRANDARGKGQQRVRFDPRRGAALDPRPPAQIAYRTKSSAVANREEKSWKRRKATAEEYAKSLVESPAIAKNDILLVKTKAERGCEWWLAKSLHDHPVEPVTGKSRKSKIEVQWMHPQYTVAQFKALPRESRAQKRREETVVPANDLNVQFVEWFQAPPGGGTGTVKNTAMIDRHSINFVGVQLTKRGVINHHFKATIASLMIGFNCARDEGNHLSYDPCSEDEDVDGEDTEVSVLMYQNIEGVI